MSSSSERKLHPSFQKGMEEIRAFKKEWDAGYKAIGRAGALLLILQVRDKNCRKYQILKAGKDGQFPLYAVRHVGFLGAKAVPGFPPGRMTEVEKQLRVACEKIVGSISDADLDSIVTEMDLAPVTGDRLAKRLLAL